jgi:hypothetical protein
MMHPISVRVCCHFENKVLDPPETESAMPSCIKEEGITRSTMLVNGNKLPPHMHLSSPVNIIFVLVLEAIHEMPHTCKNFQK